MLSFMKKVGIVAVFYIFFLYSLSSLLFISTTPRQFVNKASYKMVSTGTNEMRRLEAIKNTAATNITAYIMTWDGKRKLIEVDSPSNTHSGKPQQPMHTRRRRLLSPEMENFRKIKHYMYQERLTQKPSFQSGNLSHFYIFGAAMSNSSVNFTWDEIRIYGQMYKNHLKQGHIRCCIKYKDGYTMIRFPSEKAVEQDSLFIAFYYVCPVFRRGGMVPDKVAIAFGSLSCESNGLPYVTPFFPQKQHNKLGISCKISYGALSSEAAIEWLEAMKFLGVDKVITYADVSLNEAALITLQYYERTGFLDVFPYEQPGEDMFPRTPNMKNVQKYEDARVVIYDAYERMRGYTNFGIIDMDEFLLPSNNRTIKQLMMAMKEELYEKDYTIDRVAGLYFRSSYFIKTWGMVNASSEFEIGQYLNQTEGEPVFDMQKAIVFNDRISIFTFTHGVESKPGFTMYDCPSDAAYIRHYRSCRAKWMVEGNECMNSFVRVTNHEMINWVNRNIAANIRHVRKHLFGSTENMM